MLTLPHRLVGDPTFDEESRPMDRIATTPETDASTTPDALIESESLVEEVSIDGMCGVY